MNNYDLEIINVECETSVNISIELKTFNKPLRALRELRGERMLTTKGTKNTKGLEVE